MSAMCVGFFIAYLDIQIVAASLKEIGGGLSASEDEIAWVQTSYLIAEIVVIPLSGWKCDHLFDVGRGRAQQARNRDRRLRRRKRPRLPRTDGISFAYRFPSLRCASRGAEPKNSGTSPRVIAGLDPATHGEPRISMDHRA